jgi:hypothetical protein
MSARFTAVRRFSAAALVAALGFAVALSSDARAAGPGKAVVRPIEDFVLTQGTFCFDFGSGCHLFVPPVQNFIGWSDPTHCVLASFDYAGLADAWITDATAGAITFNTTFDGSVVERPLPDGRALLHVTLRTRNALAWAVENCAGSFNVPLIYGARVTDVMLGAQPVLGDIHMTLTLTNTAPGDPIPDLIQLLVVPATGQELLAVSVVASAGEPFASGGSGQLQTVQRGLFFTPSGSPNWDLFPAERITLR